MNEVAYLCAKLIDALGEIGVAAEELPVGTLPAGACRHLRDAVRSVTQARQAIERHRPQEVAFRDEVLPG